MGQKNVVVFTGTLTVTQYVDILEAALIPFLDEVCIHIPCDVFLVDSDVSAIPSHQATPKPAPEA